MFTNIYSIPVILLMFFFAHSTQSMEKKSKQHIYYEDYDNDIKKKTDVDDCKSIQSMKEEKLKAFNESDIYFSMSDSGCFGDTEKKINGTTERCSLYESILSGDELSDHELVEIMDEIDQSVDTRKKIEEKAKFLDEYIQENFIMTSEIISKTTQIERPEPDKKLVKEVKVEKAFVIMDDYENPSPNALPVNPDNIQPVTSDWRTWANDMVSLASDKLVPVGEYLYELNKDITSFTK